MEVFRFVVFWSHIILSTSLEDLAYNKSATQSSNLHENKWLAGAAVDGNGNQILSGNSCACTAYYKPTVWWKIDLGNVYAISSVKIFYRDEGTVFRLSGFKLYVTLEDNFISSSPVYVNNNGVQIEPYLPANFTVTVATYGQYVTLYKDRSQSCVGDTTPNTNFCALFELCEVEVLGCPKKRYGTDCQSDCPDNCLYDVCAVSDGKCYQCKAGYTGDLCDQPCVAGTYGIHCSQKCSGNCKGGTNCDATTGICPSGCSDGYQGPYCNTTCVNGRYGPGCSQYCGHCYNSMTCDRHTGICPRGCADGYKYILCKEKCDLGRYGKNCSFVCSSCNTTCDHVTGECGAVKILNFMNCIQELKLPFIIYGVITSVIICFSTALNIWLLRQKMSLRSQNQIRTNDFEFSLSEKSGQKDNSGNLSKIKSGNTTKISSCCSQESITQKYEELGPIRVEKSNYEILRKGEGSVHPRQKETKDSCNRLVTNNVGTDDKNFEKLLADRAENSYESLRDDVISEYANA